MQKQSEEFMDENKTGRKEHFPNEETTRLTVILPKKTAEELAIRSIRLNESRNRIINEALWNHFEKLDRGGEKE